MSKKYNVTMEWRPNPHEQLSKAPEGTLFLLRKEEGSIHLCEINHSEDEEGCAVESEGICMAVCYDDEEGGVHLISASNCPNATYMLLQPNSPEDALEPDSINTEPMAPPESDYDSPDLSAEEEAAELADFRKNQVHIYHVIPEAGMPVFGKERVLPIGFHGDELYLPVVASPVGEATALGIIEDPDGEPSVFASIGYGVLLMREEWLRTVIPEGDSAYDSLCRQALQIRKNPNHFRELAVEGVQIEYVRLEEVNHRAKTKMPGKV